MDEEIAFCRYGTALEPLEEDDVPAKKPIAIEDQIVTDSNGKRRFHGAFTGGFSAGFWNTVGSLEGWKPQSFKSSRNEKAELTNQKVFDFMDDEDLGEFGIAPQRVQTTDEFTPQSTEASSSSAARKHKLQQPSTGPIPGTPVLHQLLEPAKDNIAKRLLKKMGWKEGQGVGARLTKQEKKAARERNEREQYVMRMYGCEIGKSPVPEKKPDSTVEDSSSDISDSEITFAPDDFEAFVCGIKDNTFGLGYVGLNRNPVLSKQKHVNLFDAFEVVGTGNKKISIRGQAFGVGALEEEDDDIYEHVDMTKYDFSLEESRKRKSAAEADRVTDKSVLDGFHAPRNKLGSGKKVFTVNLPDVFVPRNFAVRRSRFEPIDDRRMAALQKQSEHLKMGLGKHDLDPEDRGRILGESHREKPSTSSSARDEPSTSKEESKIVQEKSKSAGNQQRKMSYLEKINQKYKSKEVKNEKMLKLLDNDRFTSGGLISTKEDDVQVDESVRKDNEEVLSKAEKITEKLDTKSTVFKPFLGDAAKQERYEKFVEAKLRFDDDITKFLDTIQPLSMNDWDREMEKKEFLQARNIYKPLRGLMSDRFISEVAAVKEKEPEPTVIEKNVEINRTKCTWKPNSVLCKKFNVAEPFGGTMTADRMTKRSRFSVFDYIETSVNRKDNFVTPVIRPTKAEKPKPIIQQPVQRITEFVNETKNSDRLSTKDLFLQEKSGDTTKTRPKDSSAKKNESLETKSPRPPKSQAEVKKPPKPQTELEKRILETKNKHPSEKKDLFKAIFESDDDDEDEKKETKPSETDSQLQVPSKNLNPAESSKSLTEINILESTALPKGIFSMSNPAKIDANTPKPTSAHSNAKEIEKSITPKELNQQQSTESESNRLPTKIVFTSRDKREKKPETTDEHFYGPKIPTSFVPRQTVHSISPEKEEEEVDSKILEHLKKGKKEKVLIEEWVEKTEAEASSSIKKKKKDKEKDKDKEKSKDKKKSKKHKKDKKHKNKK